MYILFHHLIFLKALFVFAGTNEIVADIEAQVIIINVFIILSRFGQYAY